jgi:cystathionine gamma-synthase
MPTSEHKTATSTESVHAGDPRTKPFDAIPQPVVMTATYSFEGTRELVAMKEGTHARAEREEYGRYGNPTCRALELRMAALEGCEDAALFATGMAAVTTTILAMVKAGQHVVLVGDGYRMTRQFVTHTLPGFGVDHTVVPSGDVAAVAASIRPTTRLVVGESPTNPYLRCIDLAGLARVAAGQRGVKTLIDATFATPYNCRPASFGVDLVVHSATKYLAGHNDVLAGIVSGTSALVSVVRDLRGLLGGVCDPHAAFLVARGLKTLALRVERQNATALSVARHLERHPAVARVHYPALASHPDHATATVQMKGAGGVVSFEVKGGLDAACRAVDRMTLARMAPSLGGVETLVEVPAVMSYYELTPDERARTGIAEGLVRLAVGIEDAEDILADLDRALASPAP